jgi:hypothetical protein
MSGGVAQVRISSGADLREFIATFAVYVAPRADHLALFHASTP